LAIYRTLPNVIVMHPSDVVSTRELTIQLAETGSPSYTRTARNKTPVLYEGREDEIKIGKGIVLKHGGDVAIIACGVMVSQSLEAAEALASEGINATVVDMHTLKPLDGELVDRLVADCGAIVTAEDHSVIGGLGGAVAEHLTANTFAPLERVGVQDRFGESGQADEMLDVMQISAPYIAAAAKRAMARKD
jgi:transketolase